jgi:DNA polymerase III epsilon subunit-like protein
MVIDWTNEDVGIDPKTKQPISDPITKLPISLPLIERFPNIIQFSYVLYDLDTHEYSMYNKYVLNFQEDVVALLSNPGTHETIKGALIKRKEAMEEENQPLMATRLQIITDFLGMLTSNPDITLVGHNVAFDYRMMLAEAYRLSIEEDSEISYEGVAELMKTFKTHCTCKSLNNKGAKIFDQKKKWEGGKPVPVVDKDGNPEKGEPRGFVALHNLHQKLFGYIPEDLHDSLTDSIVTLRCYYRLMNPKPETGVAFCGPGSPDIYLNIPHLGTIQSHIERITPDESKIALESKAPAPECTDTVLGGNRKRTRRKKQKSRGKKYTSRRRR